MNPLVFALLGYGGLFLASAFVVGLIVALGKSRLWMPFVLDQLVVAESSLSAEEGAFLEVRGKELAVLGFRPILTYRSANWPRPSLTRSWLDPTTTIIASAHAMVTSPRTQARFLSMMSYGAGESAVATRNMPEVSIFDELPEQKTLAVVEASTAEALLVAHRAAVEKAGLVPVSQSEATFLGETMRRYRRFCEFQEERGLLRRDEQSKRWLGTLRAHARLISGQLLPSAADFEASKLIRAVLAGAVVPAAAVLWSFSRGGAWLLLSQAAIFVSGFVASLFFTARAWPWALMLGALPLLFGHWQGPQPAFILFIGALMGNVFALRRRGLVASGPGGNRRIVRTVIIWAVLVILFFFFYSYFSRRQPRWRHVERETITTPTR